MELSIQSLTKAMFGYRSLESLANYGFVKGNDAKVSALGNVFVQVKPQLIDYF